RADSFFDDVRDRRRACRSAPEDHVSTPLVDPDRVDPRRPEPCGGGERGRSPMTANQVQRIVAGIATVALFSRGVAAQESSAAVVGSVSVAAPGGPAVV